MSSRKALITGITGQDGSYLAELLLSKGYEVHGLIRRPLPGSANLWPERIGHLQGRVVLHSAPSDSFQRFCQILQKARPDECYHLGAQSVVVSNSYEDEFGTLTTNVNGTHYLLAAVRTVVPGCRFFFAGSSEMFGGAGETPQSEKTPFHPRSIYGISKLTGFELTRKYRESHGIHASTGILFNHESPRRGRNFVSRKITLGIADILAGRSSELRLGNLDSRRDWGHAREYVQAMWLMLQQSSADDYVIATGTTHSVREFMELAFGAAGLHPDRYVKIDPALFRRVENVLTGDAGKAFERFGWRASVSFEDLIREMVESDCRAVGVELSKVGAGA